MFPIIQHLTDTDLYTITVGQAVLEHYPGTIVEYELVVRDDDIQFPDGFGYELKRQLDEMKSLRLTNPEKDFIREKFPYIKESYVEWLSQYLFDAKEVTISQEGGTLQVKIRGRWERTVYWEIPILATICELYYQMTMQHPIEGWKDRTIQKAIDLSEIGVDFMEFGSRRRFSFDVQVEVIQLLNQFAPEYFKGTSNVFHGMATGLTVFGTMSHQWIQGNSAFHGVRGANRHSLKLWDETYQGRLGIALPDTYGLKDFLFDFNAHYARLFDGVRHDSGDPLTFVDRMVAHYKSDAIKVDHKTRRIVFSDSLNTSKIREIHDHCRGQVRDSYGIGTFLTNDVGVKPLNIVMKLFRVETRGRLIEVVKISDTPEKATGDRMAVRAALYEIGTLE